MQAPQTPPPLTLPPAVYPGAPVKKGNNPDYVPIGFSVAKNLDPILKKVKDKRFTTPPPTRITEPPPLVRKKLR